MVVEPVFLILGNPECLGIVLIRASDRKILVSFDGQMMLSVNR